MTKHTDFLSHVKAAHPALHTKITSHPDFDATKHNSLRGAMSLDPDKGPTLSDEECGELAQSLFGAADKHGNDYANELMFGKPDNDRMTDDGDLDDVDSDDDDVDGELGAFGGEPIPAAGQDAKRKSRKAA